MILYLSPRRQLNITKKKITKNKNNFLPIAFTNMNIATFKPRVTIKTSAR